MTVKRIGKAFEDERGAIADVLQSEPIEHVSVIESNAGAVRGNHFHRETYQWVYVLSGALGYAVEVPGGQVKRGVVRAGDLLLTEPMEAHAMEALEPSSMLVLTRGPRGGESYESDTYRLDAPLIPGPP
jgi:quercetin dioxygenase-like cupin family protein